MRQRLRLLFNSISTGSSEDGVPWCDADLMKRAQYRGTTVRATKYDANSAITTVSASAEKRYRLTPYKNVTGKNTTEVVSVAASTGRATSRPPRSAAISGGSPDSRWR